MQCENVCLCVSGVTLMCCLLAAEHVCCKAECCLFLMYVNQVRIVRRTPSVIIQNCANVRVCGWVGELLRSRCALHPSWLTVY